MTSERAARETAERIASLGLPGGDLETISVDDGHLGVLLSELSNNRVLGLFVSGYESGAIESVQAVVDEITTAHDVVMSQTMRIEIAAIRVSRLLADAGIDHRLLKGAALAHSVALSPSERSFRDVDLLVPARQMSAAVALLMGAGAHRLQAELRPGYDERYGKSVTLRLDDVEVDLHRVLSPGPFGVWMQPNDFFVLKESRSLGGVEIPTLDRTEHLVHACYHVALGQRVPVLSNLRDIALLAGTDDEPSYDVERFAETVTRWRGRAVVRRAVGLVQDRLDVELPTALRRFGQDPVDVGELEAIEPYLTDDASGRFAALAPSTLRALPLLDRAGYALAVGLPDGARPADRVSALLKRWR